MKREKGFTLIELVIVLILIGIVAAVAVPKFMDLEEEAKKNAVKGAVASVRSAINIYYANASLKNKTTKYPNSVAVLKSILNGPVPKNPINNKDDIDAGNYTFGTLNSNYGWRYNTTTGQFWSAVSGGFYANSF